MKISPILIAIFLFTVLVQPFAAHARQQTISVNDIRPGMKGYGLTVFRGTTPERFDVEVVDVVPNFLLRQNIILIQCSHPITDKAGVIGGMSGSPIFLEGKLAGALAYGWQFNKEALAGVTPIDNMYQITERKQRGSSVQNPFEKLALFQTPRQQANQLLTETLFEKWTADHRSNLVPARTPLSLSGFTGESLKMIEDALTPFGMDPMQGGSSAQSAEGPTTFEDGGAIGVQMIRGDLSATGIGTVTTTYNGQVLAFGHPMFNMGESYLPVTTAKIHTVVASLARSNKMGTPLREIGSLVQDRVAGISARTDLRASMIPVTFHIHDKRSQFSDTYKVFVANRQWLTPRLVHSSLVQFIQHACSDAADMSATIVGKIKISGRPVFELNDNGVSRKGLAPLVAYFRPAAVVDAILSNPYEDATIEWMDFQVELEYGLSFSYLKGAYMTAAHPVPGDIVNLYVRLVDYGGQESIKSIPIQIPQGTQGKKIKVTVGGGSNIAPNLPTPESLDDLLSNVQSFYPSDAVVVTVEIPSESLNIRGRVLYDLPASAASALSPSAGDDESESYKTKLTQVVPVNSIVSGEHTIQITVGRRTK